MQYRVNGKNQDKLSALGFGFMRLPTTAGVKPRPDREKSVNLVKLAYELGINYYDTAYLYMGGESEKILGEAVAPFRDKIKIADKLPLFYVRKSPDIERLFNISLRRVGTGYFDYYLMHSMIDYRQWEKMKSLGIIEWLQTKKDKGEIINAGFSFHGKLEEFLLILHDYDWDFTQIQYNFLDTEYQAGTEGLKAAYSAGVPVFVMEPLRGGMIVNNQPPKAVEMWSKAEPKRSIADWGLRWVLNHKEVTLLLSGMNTEEQIRENCAIVEDAYPDSLSERELKYFEKAKEIIDNTKAVPCTGCGYCMPCASGVDIPSCFKVYNNKHSLKARKSRIKYISDLAVLSDKPGHASQCTKCGMCETRCPQGIDIRSELIKVRKEFELPFYKTFIKIVKKLVYNK
jgi:predicted aldo/keto reductase-like oxidoreductase